MGELQEFVHKAQKFLQSAGGNFGQRGYYGMRDNGSQGGGYNQGGNYGQREQPWMHRGPQGYPNQGVPQGWGDFPNMDPRLFM